MGIHRNRQRGTWQSELEYTLRGQSHRVRKDFQKKSDAEAHHREIEEMVRRAKAAETLGLLPEPGAAAGELDRRKLTFESWWNDCREYARMRNRPTTLARKENIVRVHLLPALGKLPLAAIRPADLERLQTGMLAKGLAPATVRQGMSVAGWMLRRAFRLGILDKNPLTAVEKVVIRSAEQGWTFLDFDECDRYLREAEQEGPVWYAMLLMAVRTGLRRGELYGLRWADLALDRKQVQVKNTRTRVCGTRAIVEGPPKSGKGRVVGLPPMLVAALRKLPSRFRGGYVFTDEEGLELSPDAERKVHARVMRRTGLERHIRFHDLRHTWASHLAMRGVPLAVLQQLGGWSCYAMVQRYAHLSRESVVSAVNVLEEKPSKSLGTQQGPQQAAFQAWDAFDQ